VELPLPTAGSQSTRARSTPYSAYVSRHDWNVGTSVSTMTPSKSKRSAVITWREGTPPTSVIAFAKLS